MEGVVNDLLEPTEGALKELPEEPLLLKEGEAEGLLKPPEGGVNDLFPLTDGTLEEPSKDLS